MQCAKVEAVREHYKVCGYCGTPHEPAKCRCVSYEHETGPRGYRMTEERHAYMGTAIEKFNEEGKLWWLRLCPACGALVGAMEQK